MNDQTPPKALATMRAGAAALLPIYPTTFEEVVRLARMAIFAGMIKPLKTGYGDNVQIEDARSTEARATMIVMQGMELGLPPMQSVQLLAMINGRITAHSEAVPGILLSKGFKIKKSFAGTEYEDDFKAVCELTRPDGQVFVTEFSVRDAKKADLWDQSPTKTSYSKTKPNDSAWFRYPKRMLWARALGFASKDGGSDAMRGLMVREEVEDMIRSGEIVDITPNRQIAPSATVPEIPEVPPVPTVPEETQVSPSDDPKLSPDQEQQFLEKLADEIAVAGNQEAVQEVADQYADILERMSDEGRRAAEKIIEGRG